MDAPGSRFSVLFVCTANICRSPMAVGLWRTLVAENSLGEGLVEWIIDSAGTWASFGDDAAAGTRLVLAERGIDLGPHRSQVITSQMVRDHHLVLAMERNHKEALRAEFPSQAHKIFMLTEMIGRRYDIRDPMGNSLDEFRLTADEITAILRGGFGRICELAAGRNRQAETSHTVPLVIPPVTPGELSDA